MYILPTLTYLEVVVPADASKFFIFEHFKWEPISSLISQPIIRQPVLSVACRRAANAPGAPLSGASWPEEHPTCRRRAWRAVATHAVAH